MTSRTATRITKTTIRTASRIAAAIGSHLAATLPHYCPLCRAACNAEICEACKHALPRIEYGCACCSLPLERASTTVQPTTLSNGTADTTDNILDENVCGECLKQPPPFSKSVCEFEYSGSDISALMALFKHRNNFHLANFLCRSLSEKIAQSYSNSPMPECIVPVPLHWFKQMQREYNQAELIARSLGKTLGMNVVRAVKKTNFTKAQKALNRKARLKNLAGSFSVDANTLQGKHIAIVDDVITTSATVTAVSQCLIDTGAAQVDIWALARTPKKRR